MEMDEKAAKQQAQFITKKFDPGTPTYSFYFLRQHPEISIESIPQHVHTDLPYEAKRLQAHNSFSYMRFLALLSLTPTPARRSVR